MKKTTEKGKKGEGNKRVGKKWMKKMKWKRGIKMGGKKRRWVKTDKIKFKKLIDKKRKINK